MKIIATQPQCLSEKGRRKNNQDSFFHASHADGLGAIFIVCDGVGGAADGETASQLAAEGFGEIFFQTDAATELDTQFQTTLDAVQLKFDQHLHENPQSRGMGTTLALLRLFAGGAFVAHIGDSRVYQFRGGNVLFCTEDHSLSNEMFKKGLVKSPDEVKRNVITRAIQGKSIKFVKADMSWLTDIESGDYFLVCSDGVWGSFSDVELGQILDSHAHSEEDKLLSIRDICEVNSHDNYTLIFFKVLAVEGKMEGSPAILSQPIANPSSETWTTLRASISPEDLHQNLEQTSTQISIQTLDESTTTAPEPMRQSLSNLQVEAVSSRRFSSLLLWILLGSLLALLAWTFLK